MTKQEAIMEQRMLQIKGMNLGWWFGTKCEKCCEVYPRLVRRDVTDKYHDTAYKCDVCGKQTEWTGMPWQAEEEWNEHKYQGAGVQLSFI